MPTIMTPLLLLSLLASPGNPDCQCQALPPMMLQTQGCRVGWQGEPEVYTPQAGDIILFRNRNVFARAAYYVSLSGGTTHVGLVVARPDGTLTLLEAMPGDPVLMPELHRRIHDYHGGKLSVRRRKVPLTAEQSARLTEFACAQVGKPFHLFGLLLPPVSLPFRVFGSLDPHHLDRSRWICTSLVLRTCVAAGLICPDKVNPEGACASDLAGDTWIDLSCGWYPPVPIIEACK